MSSSFPSNKLSEVGSILVQPKGEPADKLMLKVRSGKSFAEKRIFKDNNNNYYYSQ